MSLNFKARSSGFLVDLGEMQGACCNLEGNCDFTTGLDCYSTSGNKFFHNLQCSDVNCTSGVCCNNGYCSKITEQLCIEQGGTYHFNTDCATKRCWEDDDTPSEACCFETTGLCEDYHPAQCSFFGGVPQGAGTSCATVNCNNQSSATGACCVGGVCYEVGVGPDGNDYPQGFTSGDCAAVGGQFGGEGSTCDPNSTFGGSWPCTFPTGAACFGDNPYQGTIYCLDGVTSDYALNVLGAAAWKEGETCVNVVDSGIDGVRCKAAPEGACCTQQKQIISLSGPYEGQEVVSGYLCSNISEAACNAFGNSTWNGEDTICDGFDCCSETGDCDSTEGCCGVVGFLADGTKEILQKCAFEASKEAGVPDGSTEEEYYEPLLKCQETYTNAVNSGLYQAVVGSFGNDCSTLDPLTCDRTVEIYEYAFCIFEKNSFGEYVYSTCEKGEAFSIGDIPSAPTTGSADSIYTVTFGLIGGALHGSLFLDFCTACTSGQDLVRIAACCFEDTCTTVLTNDAMGIDPCPNGDLYPDKQCFIDCTTLPCCNDSTINPVGCIAQENIDTNETEDLQQQIAQVSSCVDKETLLVSTIDESTILQYVDNMPNFDAGMVSITETQKTCEDCDFDCGRNRGSCCFGGTPIHNLTQEECKFLGGIHAGCAGKPYDNVRDALSYTLPNINCADLEPTGNLNAPTMIRGVAVRQVNDMTKYRRGPFSDVEDIKKAVASDWQTNDWSNGEWKTDKLFWPQKPLVQIFWSPKP